MTSLRPCFCTLAWAGLAAGCSVVPSPTETEAEIAKAVQEQVPAIPTAAAGEEPVQIGWMRNFGDPVLLQLVEEAQANNRNLAAAAANVDRAVALARQAGAGLWPGIQATAGSTSAGTGDGPASQDLSLGLQVSWEVDVWGRLRTGVAATTASTEAVAADFRFAQVSLAAQTAKAYFVAIEAHLQTDIVKESLGVLEETARIAKIRYDNGLASRQDLALARSDLASTRERLTAVTGSHRDALRALEVLLGRYPGADLEVRQTLPEAPPAPPAGLPSALLKRRPDLIAAERRVAAAFNALALAETARLPTIGLTGSLGSSSSSLSELADPKNTAWRLGSSLLAPLFDGGRQRAGVAIATAEQEIALAEYGRAALNAFSELERTLDRGSTIERRHDDLEEAAAEAQEAHRVADLRYREGETELLDALTIQRRVLGARQNLVSAQRARLEQRIDLHLALGGNWTE